DGRRGWRCAHPLIHDAAYRSLPGPDRAILHTRVADRLEASQPEGPIATVARHRASAGDARRAIPLLLRAADQAITLGAPTEAAGYLENAAALETDAAAAAALRRRATEARELAPGHLTQPIRQAV